MVITNLAGILTANAVTLSLIAGCLVLLIIGDSLERWLNELFTAFLIVCLLVDMAEMADAALAFSSTFSPWRVVVSSLAYFLRPAALVLYIAVLLRKEKMKLFIWIPLVIEALFLIINAFTPIVFTYGDNNYFLRGPLGFLPHVVTAFYFVLLLLYTWKRRANLARHESGVVIFIVVLCTIATVIESFWSVRFFLIGAIVISGTIYYLYLYVQANNQDPLTGVLSRRYFYYALDKKKGTDYVLISCDLNGLKRLNDSEGHDAGDRALVALARDLSVAGGRAFTVYRTGGDEFMVIGEKKSVKDAEKLIEETKIMLSSRGYMASFGVALHADGTDVEATCRAADVLMYEDKSHYAHRA